ncbi:TadG family pilus assembly protein [Burkholderia gladioli]|uniref:TadG family pilus assembly protein n=1 Tax=Burkholderia gladioli TaxID=28095 RepID=UPI00064AF36E|nr:TadG family pilus assembly protein [Burkholderia gladioli]MDA0571905.1 pilus assembly protein TadG-related protein [Burkholderia gladioli]MDA0599951.1 pilus assembly protein TadG-related protein [Burkholderia gladioli]
MKPAQSRRIGSSIPGRTIVGRRRERGAFAVMTLIFLAAAISILGVIDIGNAFFQRRDLQRIADMAALAGAQRLDNACAQAPVTATAAATKNGLNTGAGDTITVGCGRWDPSVNAAPSYYVPAANVGTGSSNPNALQLNGVQVKLTRQVRHFFVGPTQTVRASSTARATAIDVFSVGATLAQLGGTSCSGTPASSSANPGLVNGLLGALLGSKSGLNLSLVSYQALACTNVRLADIAAAAGVGTIDQLLALNLSLSQFLKLTANALQQTSVVNANLQASLGALQAMISANVNGGNLNLGGPNGLLNIALANTQSAATATVSLLDLIMVGAEVANSNNAVAVNIPSVSLGGLTGTQLQVQIISPPSIGIGEGGINPATGQWRTQASTAAVGLYLLVDLGLKQVPIVGPLLQLVGVNVDVTLPLYLQVGTGKAVLNSTQCAQTAAASTATITATPGVANLCIGTPPLNSKGMISLSSTYSCKSPAQIINAQIAPFGILNLLQLTVSVSNISVQVQGAAQTHTFSGVAGLDSDYWTVNSNALGSALASALAQLATAQISPNLGLLGNLISVALPSNFVGTILGILQPVLGPLLSALDAVIVPLLNLLGVQVGAATVHQISLTCGVAQTVY